MPCLFTLLLDGYPISTMKSAFELFSDLSRAHPRHSRVLGIERNPTGVLPSLVYRLFGYPDLIFKGGTYDRPILHRFHRY